MLYWLQDCHKIEVSFLDVLSVQQVSIPSNISSASERSSIFSEKSHLDGF